MANESTKSAHTPNSAIAIVIAHRLTQRIRLLRIGSQHMANIVALLESMWGWGGYNEAGEDAPRHFLINPDNFSGRRLHRICGFNSLLVTNCCRTVQASANHHGIPDVEWVRENLTFLSSKKMDLLLVCGKVAHETFAKVCQMRTLTTGTVGYVGITHDDPSRVKYIAMDHPAARRWSNATLDAMTERIIEALK